MVHTIVVVSDAFEVVTYVITETKRSNLGLFVLLIEDKRHFTAYWEDTKKGKLEKAKNATMSSLDFWHH